MLINVDKNDLFPCYSPLFTKFLVEVKNIEYVHEELNIYTHKKCWIFIKTINFDNALEEWRNRKLQNELIYPKSQSR